LLHSSISLFYNLTSPSEIYPLSLHDALPIFVYKPRPVAMERCYYDLVAWLNDRGLSPDLKVVRTLEDSEFGWMEFVPVAPCDTRSEEHTSELQSLTNLVCRLLLEKKKHTARR